MEDVKQEDAAPAPEMSSQAVAPRQTTPLKPEQVITGRYKVISLVGQGGMGSVYQVEDLHSKEHFALKTLHPENVNDITWRRFEKEAKAAQMLDHPVLLRVHDLGVTDENQPFFVMDYFDGETLANRIRNTGPLNLEFALHIFIQTCFALGHAHKQGVIHRDIKPSNIMISRDGDQPEVRIVDFGIAKLVSADSESMALTKTGEIFGTPYYMSPEQCLGTPVDHRADIYSLGCVLFEALAGTPPFLGESALSTMMKHQSEKPPTLREASLGRAFPEAIETIVAKMLEKKPEDRYQDLFEVASDLNRLKQGAEVKPRQRLQEETAPSSFKFTTTVAMVVLFSIASFLAGRLTAGSNESEPKPPVKGSDSADAFQGLPIDFDRSGRFDTKQKYFSSFSSTTPSVRYFRFPPGLSGSIGLMMDVDPAMKIFRVENGQLEELFEGKRQMYGDIIVENFKPFGMRSSSYIIEHPEMFARFRNNELRSLSFFWQRVTENTLQHVAKLQSLKALLLLYPGPLADESFKYVNELDELEELTITKARMTGRGLAKLKRLKQFSRLRIAGLHYMSPMLAALQGSTSIRDLAINGNVKNEDLRLIATLPNLEILDLSENEDIDEKGLAHLTSLGNLQRLYLQNCRIDPQFIPKFAAFPKLKRLVITVPNWTSEQKLALEKLLPSDCRITRQYLPEDRR